VVKVNLILKVINYLRKLFSIRIHIILHSLTLIGLSFGGCAFIVLIILNNEINTYSNNIGNNLSKQTANLATNMIATKDTLGLTLLIKDLLQNPMVSYVAIYDVNGKTLAKSGIDIDEDSLMFIQQITLHNNLIGQINLKLNKYYLESPITKILNNLIIVALVLIAITVFMSYLLGNYILNPITKLTNWASDNTELPNFSNRHDEINLLTNSLQKRITNFETKSNNPDNSNENKPLPQLEQTAVLLIRLGAQKQLHKLPPTKLLDILERYRNYLTKSASLYRGELFRLSNGSNVLLFHSKNCGNDYLTAALYCGELIRMLGHDLQVELAGTNVTLRLCLALSNSESLFNITETELIKAPACEKTIELAEHSRNLLLIDNELGNTQHLSLIAKLRAINEPYSCFCVERLFEPHLSYLDEQLQKLHSA